MVPPVDVPSDQIKSDRQKSRLNKRKAATDLLNSTREELFAGEYEAFVTSAPYMFLIRTSHFRLIVASDYEPFSILEKLVPYLAGSASIVVQSPHVQVRHLKVSEFVLDTLQILSDLHTKLRTLPGYLCPSVNEVWLRRYQVLPGRTHPTMNTSGTGGFILHAIKVYVFVVCESAQVDSSVDTMTKMRMR